MSDIHVEEYTDGSYVIEVKVYKRNLDELEAIREASKILQREVMRREVKRW